jgi:hypothetical protein
VRAGHGQLVGENENTAAGRELAPEVIAGHGTPIHGADPAHPRHIVRQSPDVRGSDNGDTAERSAWWSGLNAAKSGSIRLCFLSGAEPSVASDFRGNPQPHPDKWECTVERAEEKVSGAQPYRGCPG